MNPFSQGFPGSIYSVDTPTWLSQFLTALAVNSAPLSDRMYLGIPRVDKIVAPHMVCMLSPEPHATAIVKPQPTSLWLFPWHLEPFLLPDPLDPLVIHTPSFEPEHRSDSSIAITPIHARQLDDPLRQWQLVVSHARQIPLRCSWLFQEFARPPLGNSKAIPYCINRFSLPVRAQKFPDATSCNIALSSERSATSFLSRAFSFSRSLSLRAWSVLRPPYSFRHR